MIISEGYIEEPVIKTPGHNSVDEILTEEKAVPPHRYADTIAMGADMFNRNSLNTASPSLAEYNDNESRVGGGRIDYNNPGARNPNSY